MIARGKIHSSGPKLAAYLVTGGPGEQAELIELRGVAGATIQEAFADLQHIAEGTNADKPFFHGYVRLPDNERLSREQWLIVADQMEAALGFQGQARAVALHHGGPEGNHLHIAWNRINLDTMKAIDPGLYKLKMKAEARLIERDFGLRQLDGGPNPDRLTKTAKQPEFQQSRRLDTDLDAIRNGIRQAWDASDGGPALQAAIAERGWILARGDRREFLVIDERGGEHALGKRVCGVTAGEVKTRLGGDEFKQTLPHVDDAKAMQKAREQERDAGQQRDDERGRYDDRKRDREHDRKRGSKEAGRATVATTDGGMVAQQREAARLLKRQARDERVRAAQADINAHAKNDDGRDNDGGRRRTRGR
jgi:hypothetical protein